MRLRHPDGQLVHLSYGMNVHPVDDVPGVVDHLDTYAAVIRRRLDVDVLGVSLGLPAPVVAGLAVDRRARTRLRSELDARGIEVVTLNGVSTGSLRAPAGKRDPYRPDWSTSQRLDHTLDLARVLVDLLPDDALRGSISTLGLGWRQDWDPRRDTAAARMLDRLSAGLAELAWQTGRAVRVAFLPEPGCVLQSTADVATRLARVDTDRLGVCLDLGNLACAWEEPGPALARLAAAGLPVVRVQLSTALQATDPVAAAGTLLEYADDRFLHQTCPTEGSDVPDLDEALRDGVPAPWRIRYPTPLHTTVPAPLITTSAVLHDGIRHLFGGARGCDHVDVETYTWDVLPAGRRPAGPADLAEGVAAELAFAREELLGRGLRPATCATTCR